MEQKKFAVIGGGIAGMFAANSLKEKFPAAKVDIFEKGATCGGVARDQLIESSKYKKMLILPNGTHYTGNGLIGNFLRQYEIKLLITEMEEFSVNSFSNGKLAITKGTSYPMLDKDEAPISAMQARKHISESQNGAISLKSYLQLLWGGKAESTINNLETKTGLDFYGLSALSKSSFLLTKFFKDPCSNNHDEMNKLQQPFLHTPQEIPLKVAIPLEGWRTTFESINQEFRRRGIEMRYFQNISMKDCHRENDGYLINDQHYSSIIWRGNLGEVLRWTNNRLSPQAKWRTPKRYITHCTANNLENFSPGAYLMDYSDRSSILRIHRTPYEREFSVITIESFSSFRNAEYDHLLSILQHLENDAIDIDIDILRTYSFWDYTLIPYGFEVNYDRHLFDKFTNVWEGR